MEYYKALNTSATHPENSNDAGSVFFENFTPLENTDEQMSQGKVSAEECLKALNDFQNEKSPGTGGLPAEFYKRFWKELHLDMIKTLLLIQELCQFLKEERLLHSSRNQIKTPHHWRISDQSLLSTLAIKYWQKQLRRD